MAYARRSTPKVYLSPTQACANSNRSFQHKLFIHRNRNIDFRPVTTYEGFDADVIDGSTLTVTMFSSHYVAPAKPVIIRNLPFALSDMLSKFGVRRTPLDQLPVDHHIDHRQGHEHADVGGTRPITMREALSLSSGSRVNFYDIQL